MLQQSGMTLTGPISEGRKEIAAWNVFVCSSCENFNVLLLLLMQNFRSTIKVLSIIYAHEAKLQKIFEGVSY